MQYLILIYPLFFLIYYSSIKRSIRTQLPYLALWALFFGSSVASVYLVFTDDIYKNTFFGIISIMYNCWMFSVLLKTNEKLCHLSKKEIVNTHPIILNFTTLLVIALGVPSFFYTVSSIDIASFSANILTMRQELGESSGDSGLMGYLTYFSKSYWVLSLSLAFYYIIKYPKKKIIIGLLFMSSLSRVVYGLSHAGRGDVLIYFLVTVMMFLLLCSKMSYKSKKIFKILGFSVGGLLLCVFILISVVRFGVGNSFYSGSDSTAFDAIIRYYGLGFTKFSQEFNAFWLGVDGGACHFPFFVGRSVSSLNVGERVNVDFELNTFSTSIGGLIFDIGAFFTIFFIYLWYYSASHLSRRPLNVFTLFYAAWLYSYLVEAIFYFSDIFTGARVMSLLFIILLDLLNSSLVSRNKRFKNI